VSIVDVVGGRTNVALRRTDGPDDVVAVHALPDREQARRVTRGIDRILWQRLELAERQPHAVVACVQHRRPVFVRVAISTGLALLVAGLPTLATASVTR